MVESGCHVEVDVTSSGESNNPTITHKLGHQPDDTNGRPDSTINTKIEEFNSEEYPITYPDYKSFTDNSFDKRISRIRR